jgi:hypothetical protein
MDLAIEPDIYSPSISEAGNYVDKISPFKKGLRCPCGSRKDKIYDTVAMFSAHCKTKCHQKWLETINLNKANHFAENISLHETIQNQRLIISQLEKNLQTKSLTIDYLTQQLDNMRCSSASIVQNLIDFD